MKQRKYTLGKSILFSVIIVCVFFAALEFTARLYYFIKCGEKDALTYGGKYIKNLNELFLNSPYRQFNLREKDEKNLKAEKLFVGRKKLKHTITKSESSRITLEGGIGYRAYINGYNYRNRDITLEKPEGLIRIMIIGGSFVYGFMVDDDSTIPYLLEYELNADGLKYEVINGGKCRADINDLFIDLIEKHKYFKPDYLIVFSNYNNHTMVSTDYGKSVLWHAASFFYNTSVLYSSIYRKISVLKYGKGQGFILTGEKFKFDPQKVDSAVSIYNRRLEQLKIVCDENGIKPIFGLQPICIMSKSDMFKNTMSESIINSMRSKDAMEYWEFKYYMQGRFNLAMADCGVKLNIPVFDGATVFLDDPWKYFMDEIHLNREGAVIFSNKLCDYLQALFAGYPAVESKKGLVL